MLRIVLVHPSEPVLLGVLAKLRMGKAHEPPVAVRGPGTIVRVLAGLVEVLEVPLLGGKDLVVHLLVPIHATNIGIGTRRGARQNVLDLMRLGNLLLLHLMLIVVHDEVTKN